jgi:hypothetical protein
MRLIYLAASALSVAALFPSTGSAQNQPLQFIPVTPCRVVDTRNATGTFGGPEMGAGSTRSFPIQSSSCGIPSNAAAYALNVTVVPDAALGFLTMWPTGQNQPLASTLNSLDGRIKANAAIVPAGSQNNGGISVFVTDNTQVVIDINGYFVSDGTAGALQFFPVTPCRVADTRGANGPLGGPFLIGNGSPRPFPILSSSCNIPGNASAYSLNFTAVPHGTLVFITVFPSDQNQPLASTLNALTGAITANAAIVPGAAGSGQVSVFASDDTDLVIDINGYFAPPSTSGLDLFNLPPCRVLDTRNNGGQPFSGTIPVHVANNCGAPGNAQGYVFNATVVPPQSLGYLTLWPDGEQQPFVSTLNALDGAITSNMAIVPTGNGSIDAFASDPTQLVLDISGYFAPIMGPPANCAGPPCAFIDSATVGNNLEAPVNINVVPAPSADTNVTVFTDRPDLVAISGSASAAGGSSYTYTQAAGTSNIAVYVQGLASSGVAHIWAQSSDPSYGSSIGTVTLSPSGFVLFSQNSTAPGGSLQIGEFGSATFTVRSALLDGSNNFVAFQPVRGMNVNGNPPPSVPTVSLSVDPNVGVVSPSSLAFGSGTDSMSTQFTASGNPGATGPLTANEPPGFDTPNNGANQVFITVGSPQLTCTNNASVGFNLATQGLCTIVGAAPVDESITLTSTNPGALLLSPNISTAGSSSITVTIRQGTSVSNPFLLIGASNSGTAGYNAASADLGNFSANVTLLRSGFVVDGGAGVGVPFPASFPGPDSTVSVIPVALDGAGNPVLALPLAPGISASVNVGSSNTAVGSIFGSPVTLNAGDSSAIVTFHPTGVGTTTISASAASPGYTFPSSGASVDAIVQQARILVTAPSLPVGNNLEVQTSVILSSAPASDLTLTLTASGPIILSSTGTDSGSTTLNLTIPAGQNSALFYIYGQANSGTATINASANGYNQGSATVAVGPSGFVILGAGGAAPIFQTPLAAGPQPLTIQPAVLDSNNNFVTFQNLAGSTGSVDVTITNQNSNAGSVPSSVTVPVGGTGTVTFTPAQSGQQTIIALAQPSGFNAPAQSPTNPGGTLTVVVQ